MVNRHALSLGAVAMLFVTPAIALDLMRSYELALVNDPVFRAVTMEYRAGLENQNIGRSAVLPKLAANYNTATNKATQWGQQFPGGPPISYNWNYPSDFAALQLTQPLFSLEALARMKQGAAQAELSKSRFLYGTQDLLIRVSQAYVDVLFASDQLRLQRAERDAFLEQSKVAERLFIRGEGSRTNVLEAQSAYQVSEARIVDAIDTLENARMKLEAIVGDSIREVGSMAVLKREFPFLVMAPNDFQAWRDKALSSNAELKAMQDQIAIASQEYQRSNADHYPVVNLVAAMTTQSSNTVSSINQTTNQNYLGVQVSLPIFSGGETAGKSAQAYANYEKAKADYEVKKNEVSVELRKQFDLVRSGAIKIRALSAAQEYATLLVESMRKNVLSGEKINLDVLLAQKSLFLTSRDLAQSQYGYLLAYLRLHQLGGSLESSDFMKVAAYFKSK
jgi:protease secretion system outer membrane protein